MMIRNLNSKKGFTLIELMVVVAIIGILAAIAVPNFLAMQLRSKRAELPANLDAIRTIEQTYIQEWSDYFSAVKNPSTAVDSVKHPWETTAAFNAWNQLGWKPEGAVFGQYAIDSNATPAGTASNLDEFIVTAVSDIDADGSNKAGYFATRDTKPIFSCNDATATSPCVYTSTVDGKLGLQTCGKTIPVTNGTCVDTMDTDQY